MRGKDTKLSEGEGSKLGEPSPKVRLSQDRLPILRTNVVRANVDSSKCHSTATTFTIMTLSITTFSLKTLSEMIFCTMELIVTLSI